MTGNPKQLGAADTTLLLEVMKSTVAGALTMSGPAQVGTTSAGNAPASTEQSGHVTEENTRLILQVLARTAESTWAVAEAARLGAVMAKEEGDMQSGGNDRHTAALIKPEEPLVKIPPIVAGRGSVPGDGPFVINERVGAITVAAWEGLSEEKLKEIDDGLKDIVKKVVGSSNEFGWHASTIQEKLAALGLQFAAPTYFPEDINYTYWERSKETRLSDLTKVLAMGDYFKTCLNRTYWYSDEMVRVLQRLMELRGFKI